MAAIVSDQQTNIFTEGGDFTVEEPYDSFRQSFELARRDGDPIIRSILGGKEIFFNADKIVAFAPTVNQKRPTVVKERPGDTVQLSPKEPRTQLCCCGHQKQAHTEGVGRCQYSPGVGQQCGCEGFEAQ